MIDREKVIEGLKHCSTCFCAECPYWSEDNCSTILKAQALVLLTEHKSSMVDADKLAKHFRDGAPDWEERGFAQMGEMYRYVADAIDLWAKAQEGAEK